MIRIALALVALLSQDDSSKPPKDAIILFDGKDTSHFTQKDGKPCAWTIVDGALEVGKGDIITKETFQDFQLHVEFNIPEPPEGAKGQARSNSGVYIQRRYEVQVLDSLGDDPPKFDGCASIYRQKAPDKNVAKKPGEWQTYDITFRGARFDASGKKTEGARITVVWNGVKVHDDYEITGKTGAKVRFRNLWIVPKK